MPGYEGVVDGIAGAFDRLIAHIPGGDVDKSVKENPLIPDPGSLPAVPLT